MRWFNWLTNAVLMLVVLLFLFMLIVPTFFYGRAAVVLTGSMEPALPEHALALSVAVEPEEIKVGDIIAFSFEEEPDVTTSHRVVTTAATDRGLFFQTKGDANEDADRQWVPAKYVRGKVFYHVPRLGNLFVMALEYVQSWLGFTLLVVVPSLLIIGNTVKGVMRPRSLGQRRLELMEKRRLRWKR